jgi:UDP-N-acetylglucosamine 3-dehydrogenase
MVNIAIIGAGFMGTTHAEAYLKIPSVKIAHICDQSEERAGALAGEIDASWTTDYKRLLDDQDVTLVDVCLPTPFHAQFAIDALKAGKHVLVEKPIALNVDEADAMIAVSKETGKILMVAHVARFAPEYRAIRSILESNQLGAPLQATTYRISNMPQWAEWFKDPTMTGGAVLDMQIHDLDLLNWLFGNPLRVMATGVRGEAGGWDHVLSLIEFSDVRASVESSFIMPMDFPFTTGFRVLCENGVVEYFFRAGGASFEIGEPQTHVLIFEAGKPPEPVKLETADGFESELNYFVNCIEKNKEPEYFTDADARLAVKVAEASRQSIESGTIIDISK